MKKNLLFIALATVAATSAHASDVGGSDWNFNYNGTYSIANLNPSNDNLVSGLLGTALNLDAQLALINGTSVAVNQPVTLSQSSLTHFSANNLSTTAVGGPGLLSGLGAFVANVVNTSNGAYNGTISGNNVTLTGANSNTLNLNGLVDTRLLGSGIVLNLEAVIPTNTYNGTITGKDSGTSTPFGGGRVNTITGTSGILDTINLEAQVETYVLGNVVSNTGFVSIGAIDNTAKSWSLTRAAATPTSTPTPASGLALAAGLLGFVVKRKRATA